MNNNQPNTVIAVELSGSPKLYHYVASTVSLLNRNVGDRVVIPNKLKEDGSLSLSIGVFKGIAVGVPTAGLKPIVEFIDAMSIRTAQLWLLADAEAAALDLTAESKVTP